MNYTTLRVIWNIDLDRRSILRAFIATKYGMGGEGKDKLINTLVYLA